MQRFIGTRRLVGKETQHMRLGVEIFITISEHVVAHQGVFTGLMGHTTINTQCFTSLRELACMQFILTVLVVIQLEAPTIQTQI